MELKGEVTMKYLKALSMKERDKALENCCGMMELYMKENGCKTGEKDVVLTYGQMGGNTKANGKMLRFKELVCIPTKMEDII